MSFQFPRILATAGLLLAGFVIPLASALGQQDGPYFDHGHMWSGGWWMMLGPVAMIVFLVAAVVITVLLVRWLGGPSHHAASHPAHNVHPAPGRGPIDILKDRYARGEIDKAEFEERRRVLEG